MGLDHPASRPSWSIPWSSARRYGPRRLARVAWSVPTSTGCWSRHRR